MYIDNLSLDTSVRVCFYVCVCTYNMHNIFRSGVIKGTDSNVVG